MSQISCAILDLETSNLAADFGIVLCGVVLPADKKPIVFRGDKLNPRWKTKRSDDSHVLKAIVDELLKYDIWIAHNGRDFDIKWLRTRLAKWKLPPLPSRMLIDPLWLARNKFKMSYNSLEALANFLGVNSKTEVDPDVWMRAALDGDRKAMDQICTHCIRDTETLEKVTQSLKPYSTLINSWGSGF